NNLDLTIQHTSSLSATAYQTFAAFEAHSQATYALTILGHTKAELIQEIQRAFNGVVDAFESRKDWQTPIGSYFTPKPLGKTGKVAFVYPGLFTAYLGLGRDIFQLFPKIWDDLTIQSSESPIDRLDRVIHPRSLNKLSSRQLEKLEQQLINDPPIMVDRGIGFARLMSVIMSHYFRVQPHCTFGYSLGEITMICAQDVWKNILTATQSLKSSPLFSNRLAGVKNAVREYWGLPLEPTQDAKTVWSSHVLIAPASQVWKRVKSENRVYLTHINTPNEVAIAGDSQACLNVIESLKCNGFRAPFDQVLHCEVMESECDEITRLCTLPIQQIPKTVFYSTANYEPIAIDSDAIGRSIARGLCQPLDFPRLIDRVYADGARVFVEAGAGSTCSRWIKETLKQREHITIPLNQRGVTDHKSIVKALAKLVSHRVALDLSPLYSSTEIATQRSRSLSTTVTLGGTLIDSFLLSPQTKKIVEVALSTDSLPLAVKESFSHQNLPLSDPPQISQTYEKNEEIVLSILQEPQNQSNSEHNVQLTKTHTAFLQARQEGLQQLSDLIQFQIAIAQNLLDKTS
ncbi:MAG: PfaB family protein, partial [Microcoleus sp.]